MSFLLTHQRKTRMPGFGGQYLDHLINTLNEAQKYFYVIRYKKIKDPFWYFLDIEETTPVQVIWVPRIRAAFTFSTEQRVEEFKADWLRNRPVEILRMEKQQWG